jgi:exodeoxyribonuclease VII small subunit
MHHLRRLRPLEQTPELTHAMPEKPPKESPSVEQALERLEALVSEMESGKLPLDTLITRFEEGMKLVVVCQEKLDAAAQKIQIITKNARGETAVTDFAANDDDR